MAISNSALRVLTYLHDADERGAHALACDGSDRAPAHELEKAGLAYWVGTQWGSSFWQITDAGRIAIANSLTATPTIDPVQEKSE